MPGSENAFCRFRTMIRLSEPKSGHALLKRTGSQNVVPNVRLFSDLRTQGVHLFPSFGHIN